LQFNLAIKFYLGRLGAKPNVLTHCWDVYDREDLDQMENLCPMFLQSQVNASLVRASTQGDLTLELGNSPRS